MNYEEIKKFIEDNDIEKRIRLREEYRKVYDCFKKLSNDEQEILLPSKPSNYSNLNTADDFKRFIKTNNITNRFMFQHKFTGAYTRFKNLLTNEEQEYVFPLKVRPLYTSLKTVEDFNQFALENDVKNRADLQDRFCAAYKRFLKLTKEEQDSIQFTEPYVSKYAGIKSPADFQEFIDNNQIFSKSQFAKEFGVLYQKYRKLPKGELSLVRFKNDKPTSLLNTLSDFQKIVDDNNLKTFKEFREQFSKEYQRYLKVIPEQDRNLIFPLSSKNPLDSLDDFQRYINENHIMSYKEFRLKHKTVYAKYLSKRPNWVVSKLIFPIMSVDKYENLQTNEDFQRFIDENGIKSKNEFRKKFGPIQNKFFKAVPREDRNLKFPIEGKHLYGSSYNNVEDFQKFINENKIPRPIVFRTDFPSLYDRLCRILSKEEKMELVYEDKINSYALINTIEEFQDFISSNKISSKAELRDLYPGLLIKAKNLNIIDDLVFHEGSHHSTGEIFLIKLFEENSIRFESEKIFSNLKYISYLRYDFYLPDLNILVEYHGEQHFGTGIYYNEGVIIRDKIKFDYAKDNNIPIIYFTNSKKVYEEKGYFTDVITDSDILIKKIKEIGLTNQLNS